MKLPGPGVIYASQSLRFTAPVRIGGGLLCSATMVKQLLVTVLVAVVVILVARMKRGRAARRDAPGAGESRRLERHRLARAVNRHPFRTDDGHPDVAGAVDDRIETRSYVYERELE